MLKTTAVFGSLVIVGMPEDAFSLRSQHFAGNGASLQGSHIGNKQEALKMLDLAAEKNIKPWIEVLDMKECSEAIKRVDKNDIRYRFVLRQDIEPVE